MKKDIKGLYAIVDNARLAYLVLLGGCRILQLRIKDNKRALWDERVFNIARQIMELKGEFEFTFIVNDYVDVAGEVGANGAHIGLDDMPIQDVRKRLGSDIIIGYSSHSIDEALAAERSGADYIAFGAIFPTKTKGVGHPVQGIKKLKELVSVVGKPIVAIGGINRTNISDVISSGAAAIAMITAITGAKDIVAEVRWVLNNQ